MTMDEIIALGLEAEYLKAYSKKQSLTQMLENRVMASRRRQIDRGEISVSSMTADEKHNHYARKYKKRRQACEISNRK